MATVGFRSEKTRSTGSEAICPNGLYAPTAADALYAGSHKANNFSRPAPERAHSAPASVLSAACMAGADGLEVHLNLAETRRGASAPSRRRAIAAWRRRACGRDLDARERERDREWLGSLVELDFGHQVSARQ